MDSSPTEFHGGKAPNKTPTKADVNNIIAGLKTWFDEFAKKSEESARELAIKRDCFAKVLTVLI